MELDLAPTNNQNLLLSVHRFSKLCKSGLNIHHNNFLRVYKFRGYPKNPADGHRLTLSALGRQNSRFVLHLVCHSII